MASRVGQREADDQPLSATMTIGPEPLSVVSFAGLSTGSARAKITNAAARSRISVSHHGVLSAVFSSFSSPTRMRVGGNSTRAGFGGTARSSQ